MSGELTQIMHEGPLWRRVLRRVDDFWDGLASLLGIRIDPDRDLHTLATYRAVVDAVVPETPDLAAELGSEHVPGGLAVALDDFLVVYVNDLFQFGLPHFGPQGNLPLAGPLAHVMDTAAVTLVARGENESEPDANRVASLLGPDDPPPRRVRKKAGLFAKLSRRDRLRAIAILDEFEIEVTPFDDALFEVDAGVVGQLAVGFAEMIYYSEWQGYDEFTQPPSERTHPNEPSAVQSWRQTGFPGYADGYAALRGYVGADDSPLGDGEVWTTIDPDASSPVRVVRESGRFRENDYDTSGYEEPYPEPDEAPAGGGT
jgi:hypothetical protein